MFKRYTVYATVALWNRVLQFQFFSNYSKCSNFLNYISPEKLQLQVQVGQSKLQ